MKSYKKHQIDIDTPSLFQKIFLSSKVNGAIYAGDYLEARQWPRLRRDTWLQRRLEETRKRQYIDSAK